MKRYSIVVAIAGAVAALAAVVYALRGYTFQLFEPKGVVAADERGLMIHAVLLMCIVVVPVLVLGFTIAWRYRAGNTKATYTPDWEHSKMEELVWWAVPFEIILILGALTYSSTHQLDPYKPLTMPGEPLVVEVVALDWKWLFIYPTLNLATVNELTIPANRPITFHITADAPMNSFWIPQLGGQIYAMTGMVTELHLAANAPGEFAGGSANYSGDGFADMKFVAKALSASDFEAWQAKARLSPLALTTNTYTILANPSTTSPATYSGVEPNLFNSISMKYMQASSEGMPAGMHMAH